MNTLLQYSEHYTGFLWEWVLCTSLICWEDTGLLVASNEWSLYCWQSLELDARTKHIEAASVTTLQSVGINFPLWDVHRQTIFKNKLKTSVHLCLSDQLSSWTLYLLHILSLFIFTYFNICFAPLFSVNNCNLHLVNCTFPYNVLFCFVYLNLYKAPWIAFVYEIHKSAFPCLTTNCTI